MGPAEKKVPFTFCFTLYAPFPSSHPRFQNHAYESHWETNCMVGGAAVEDGTNGERGQPFSLVPTWFTCQAYTPKGDIHQTLKLPTQTAINVLAEQHFCFKEGDPWRGLQVMTCSGIKERWASRAATKHTFSPLCHSRGEYIC